MRLLERGGAVLAAVAALAMLAAPLSAGPADAQDMTLTGVVAAPPGCADGMERIIKIADMSEACVKPATKIVLIERGWGQEPPMMEDPMSMMEDPTMMEDPMMPPSMPPLDLTDEETAWLDQGQTLRVAYDPYGLPLEFVADGMLGGLSVGYHDMLKVAVPVQTELVPLDSWDEALQAMREGRADIMFSVVENEQRLEYMAFTEPHTVLTWDMVTADERAVDPSDLAGMDVGIVRGYEIGDWLDANMPDVEYAEYNNAMEAITALRSGEIEVYVDTWPVASYAALTAGDGPPVHNAGKIGHDMALSIGYAKDNAVLGSILMKFLDSVPDDQKELLAMTLANPVGALASEEFIGAVGEADPAAGELLEDLVGMAEEIKSNNSEDMNALLAELLESPESVAFAEKHPEYDVRTDNLGSFQVEFRLSATDGTGTLRIEYDKESSTPTYTYMCDQNDMSDAADGEGLADRIPGLCVP